MKNVKFISVLFLGLFLSSCAFPIRDYTPYCPINTKDICQHHRGCTCPPGSKGVVELDHQ